MPMIVLKDGFVSHHQAADGSKREDMDLMSAGPNGLNDFVVVSRGGAVVRIPDEDRVKLAMYLLLPLFDGEPLLVGQTQASMVAAVGRLRLQEGFREPRAEASRPSPSRGVVARP